MFDRQSQNFWIRERQIGFSSLLESHDHVSKLPEAFHCGVGEILVGEQVSHLVRLVLENLFCDFRGMRSHVSPGVR